jgi:hypothetical protein
LNNAIQEALWDQFEDVSPLQLAVILNVIGRKPEMLAEILVEPAVTEHPDANLSVALIPFNSSAQESMSPNAEELVAKLEPNLVFAPSQHQTSSQPAEQPRNFCPHPSSVQEENLRVHFVFLFTRRKIETPEPQYPTHHI